MIDQKGSTKIETLEAGTLERQNAGTLERSNAGILKPGTQNY